MNQFDLFGAVKPKAPDWWEDFNLRINKEGIPIVPCEVCARWKDGFKPLLLPVKKPSAANPCYGWTGVGRPPRWAVEWAEQNRVPVFPREALIEALRRDMQEVLL